MCISFFIVKIGCINLSNKGNAVMNDIFEVQGSVLQIILPQELDHPASDYIRRETDKIISRVYIRTIVFDFAKTVFMDSSGIGLLMGRYRALGMRAASIRAIHVSRYMNKLLHLSGVHKFIVIEREPENLEEQKGGYYEKHQ